ncbi:MAG: type II toxin-antitoxin system RelE/ParE family toxin [Flavobacteriales bacterium]|nr:type II toxin-antitoxin system RelE/ParE family toxin [Flavobacteriales bacterium]
MISQKNINYKIRLSDIADQEINKAIEYYKNQSQTGELNFKKQLNQALNTLEINPFFQFRYKNIRAIPFKSLPYLVFFEIDENDKIIYVYSIFNTYQNPNKYPSL